MAAFLNSVRQGFRNPSNRGTNNQQQQQQRPNGSPSPTPQGGPGYAPRMPPLANSPSLASSLSLAESNHSPETMAPQQPQPRPLFLRDSMHQFVVKGNHMTLAVCPISVEKGEWLAHQVVEQFRLLNTFMTVIQSTYQKEDGSFDTHCNGRTCPTMTAGTHTYTWLDSHRQPTRLPAIQYIALVQKWISGKILDPAIFPTGAVSPVPVASTYASGSLSSPHSTTPIPAGPTSLSTPLNVLSGTPQSNSVPQQQQERDWIGKASGFPENFLAVCKNIYKQMFRVYAHVYWHHYEHPLYHLDCERYLNSAFTHFILAGTQFELLSAKDLEPVQALLDMWIAKKVFPADSLIVLRSTATNANENNASSNATGASSNAAGPSGQGQPQT
ncbi:MAG: 3'-5' DNA helicase [Chaenotheca gracillima]|nr:MAG: 3'-5' DNA helicase [Chaenotheca gracillima]